MREMSHERARHAHDQPPVLTHLLNRACKSREILRRGYSTLERFHTKFEPDRSTLSTASPIRNSAANLQTFEVFSNSGFTRQMTSDRHKILCGLIIPNQLPPYRILLKRMKASRSCLREVPSNSAQVRKMSHERARRAHDPPPGLEASPKMRVQIAPNFEGLFLYPRNVPTQNFSPIGAPHRRPFQLEILPVTSKPSQFFRNAGLPDKRPPIGLKFCVGSTFHTSSHHTKFC